MLYDNSNYIKIGIIVFLVLMLSPFWLNMMGESAVPKLELPEGKENCVETTKWMKANHMQLLEDWRQSVVRDEERTYTSHTLPKAQTFQKSLTGTCLTQCHRNKEKFCDRCHEYVSVDPFCFDCHVDQSLRKKESI